MSEERTAGIVIAAILIVIGLILFFTLTPMGRSIWNKNMADVQKADDATRYETRKQVEDTCRSMMASYTSDKLTYAQYKDSSNEKKQSWAEQAKMRANKTAASYNEYVLKNSFVWDGNVPKDISEKLEYIE